MANYNHYIGVDEQGTPYISHALNTAAMVTDSGKGGQATKRHKYLMKVRTALGKIRYIYDQAELAALNAGRKVRNKVKDKLGYDERDRRDAARKLYTTRTSDADLKRRRNEAFINAQNEYSRTALGRYEAFKAKSKARKARRQRARTERIKKRHTNDNGVTSVPYKDL